ncbi:MAG: aldo/keto reductase, partial [Verrucomicrobia bacterium]
MLDIASTVTLNNGNAMPMLGLGVYKLDDPEVLKRAVRHAFEIGYRHIDTAAGYGNEAAVGRAVAEAPLDRSEVFVTTKITNGDIRARRTRDAFQ